MDIDNLLAFETFATAKNIDVGRTRIKDWNALTVSSPQPRQTIMEPSPFKDLLFKNLRALEDIEEEAVKQHGFGENSYATHELNVFIRSPSQIRLRMCLPGKLSTDYIVYFCKNNIMYIFVSGFSFQRNQRRMHEMIRAYGAITDVEKSVDSQVNQLFKSVAKVPQHTFSAIAYNR